MYEVFCLTPENRVRRLPLMESRIDADVAYRRLIREGMWRVEMYNWDLGTTLPSQVYQSNQYLASRTARRGFLFSR